MVWGLGHKKVQKKNSKVFVDGMDSLRVKDIKADMTGTKLSKLAKINGPVRSIQIQQQCPLEFWKG